MGPYKARQSCIFTFVVLKSAMKTAKLASFVEGRATHMPPTGQPVGQQQGVCDQLGATDAA